MEWSESKEYKVDIDAAGLENELRANVNGEIRFDKTSRALYTTDGSNYRQIPIGIVIPKTKDAVIAAVGVCCKYEVPIVARGGGTALAGQTCNTAIVIDFSKYLNKVLEIDIAKKTARVEPGVILDDLRDRTFKENLTFAPDPATHNHCTFGGMLGNNSCGIHSVMAGRTADNTHELEILTYRGSVMKVGQTSESELANICIQDNVQAKIYSQLRDLRDKYADLIRQRYPQIPRRVSGYNLDNLLPENGFHVARSLVGSECSCILILEAVVRLVYNPPGRALLLLGYPDVYSAADHIPQVMEFGPVGCEGIDDKLTEFMRKKHMHVRDLPLLPEGKGWLIIEFGGEDRKDAAEKAKKLMEKLQAQKDAPRMKLYDDVEEEKDVWELRESGLGATANVPTIPLCWPGWEDSAVPPDKMGNYLRDFRKLLDKHSLIASLYGHFGQGCLHCRISFDLETHEGIKNYVQFIEQAADLVVKYGGSFSGEHGDGQSRAMLLPKMYGDTLVKAFSEFKTIWDPDWKMNPGKVVMPYRSDQNLRLGANYNPWQPATINKFPKDEGSFSRATLRCVGVGKCRRVTPKTFMCPSFIVTREEQHTTRGRAHALFEMFRGDFITNKWRSKEIWETLDKCLSCKGCKKECPVSVDMATYKSEFLFHYYYHRPHPRTAYAMGLIGFVAPLAGKMPKMANFVSHNVLTRRLFKYFGGMAQQRQVPKFANQSFTKWFTKRQSQAQGKEIVLFHDTFNNYFFPQTLKAAVHVLEYWGYKVILAADIMPSVRPLLHFGMLKLARKQLQKTLQILGPYVERGLYVIFMEPSSCSVFRDELEEMLPNSLEGQRVMKHSKLLSEFAIEQKLELPKLSGKAILHLHCHQKSVLNAECAKQILKEMGLNMEEPQPGCCGMAGSFGFESRHYETSMKIGELNLLPAVRNAESHTFIVADGFSCRTQIMEGAGGREPMHMAELLLTGFIQNEKIGRPE